MSDEIDSDQAPGAPHPRSNFAMIGHDEAESQMAAALESGRVHHAWLITGPKGVGKATMAYRFARALLGARRDGPRPFDVDPDDPVVRRIGGLAHGDLFVLRRTVGDRGKMRREIAAEDARELPGFFSLAPAEGGWRVAIVDAVDDLNRFAANALLKILEEPPSRCVLMLVCHAPGAALATIRSRCRQIALRPLETAACAATVERVLGAEPDPAVLALAKGRPGRAVMLQAMEAGGLARAIDDALRRLGRDGAAAFSSLAYQRGGADRAELFFELLLDRLASLITTPDGDGPVRVSPETAGRWAEAWSELSSLRGQADGLVMDPTHTYLRAGAILAQAAASR